MADISYRGNSPLGYDKAYHLLRRTTYKVTKERIDQFANYTANQALDELFDYESFSLDDLIEPEPIEIDTGTSIPSTPPLDIVGDVSLGTQVGSWYFNEAANADTIRFKLSIFLYTVFISVFSARPKRTYDRIKLMLYYSKESYKTFAEKISYDNLMLQYLNNNVNTVESPNENYAREFLELFTITKGEQISEGDYTTYKEHDVIQAARLLTGFRIQGSRTHLDPETQIPSGYIDVSLHDTGDKTFSEHFNNQTIQGADTVGGIRQEFHTFVEMIFNQDATAIALAKRLYRFFVYREIDDEIHNEIILPLAQTLKNNEYKLEVGLRQLLGSKHFYDEDNTTGEQNIGGLARPPLDLALQTINLLNINYSPIIQDRYKNFRFFYRFIDVELLRNASFNFLLPETVAGYPPIYQEPDYDKEWVTVNTIQNRYSLGQSLIESKNRITNIPFEIYAKFNALDFIQNSGYFTDILDSIYADPFTNASYELPQLMDRIVKLAFPMPLTDQRYNEFYHSFLLGALSEINWAVEWRNYIDGVTNGDDIRISIENVFREILSSPEYQIF